jgi:hypothetical protein
MIAAKVRVWLLSLQRDPPENMKDPCRSSIQQHCGILTVCANWQIVRGDQDFVIESEDEEFWWSDQ